MRRCIACHRDRPLSEFYPNKSYKCGLAAKCKACKAEYDRAWRAANLERERERGRNWYRANAHRIPKKSADERRPARRAYYERNRERIIATAVDIMHRRRAQRGRGRFGVAEWRAALAEYDNRCAYCGAKTKLERDHVVPLSRGGSHHAKNIVPACRRCNLSKRNKTVAEWLAR